MAHLIQTRSHTLHVAPVAAVGQRGAHQLRRKCAAGNAGVAIPQIGNGGDPVRTSRDITQPAPRSTATWRSCRVRMTRSSPSNAASRGAGSSSKSAKISSSIKMRSCASASLSMRCAVDAGQGRSGWVVHGRVRDVEPGSMVGHCLRERGDVGSARGHWDADPPWRGEPAATPGS